MNDSMLKVGGKPFYCSCGANVFHKGNKLGLWVCNGCGTEYADETYDSRETNADRIRAMSDEELAEFIDKCEAAGYNDSSIARDKNNELMNMLDWLKQPAEEDQVD